MYHHKSWGCTTTNLFGVLHKSHIFPHRAPSGAGVGISRLRPSMESYGPPAVLLQLYPVCFCFCIQLYYNYILFAFVLHSIVAIMAHLPFHYNYILCAFDFAYSTVVIMAYPPLCYNNILYAFVIAYDKVSANTASSVPKTSKFKSGDRVVKMVLNT